MWKYEDGSVELTEDELAAKVDFEERLDDGASIADAARWLEDYRTDLVLSGEFINWLVKP